jgi:hypothetical protein
LQDAEDEDKNKEVEERLFCATLQGEILEWNLSTLQPKFVTESFGGAVWGLAADHAGERLAAACEDGTVRLFAITPTSVDYLRALPKQKGKEEERKTKSEREKIVEGGRERKRGETDRRRKARLPFASLSLFSLSLSLSLSHSSLFLPLLVRASCVAWHTTRTAL